MPTLQIVTAQIVTALFTSLLLSSPVEAIESGQVSRTALAAAAARAVGNHDPDPFTRNPDWLANPFLGPSEVLMIAPNPIGHAVDQDPRIAMLDADVLAQTRLAMVRTRFIDGQLRQAVQENGVRQVAILGAGFGTRPYRFHELLEHAKVFEIDRPATQRLKRARVQAVFGGAPPNLAYVPFDFNQARFKQARLKQALIKAGFRMGEKTFFIWENGSMYFPESTVRGILGGIARWAAPGSMLVMDFAEKSAVERANRNPDSEQSRFDAAWGEPWLFGIPEHSEQTFFRELRFEPVEFLPTDSPAAIRRYLTHRDGSVVGLGIDLPPDFVPLTVAVLTIPETPAAVR
jgi:methyltransferase (TIGR00027 family)